MNLQKKPLILTTITIPFDSSILVMYWWIRSNSMVYSNHVGRIDFAGDLREVFTDQHYGIAPICII